MSTLLAMTKVNVESAWKKFGTIINNMEIPRHWRLMKTHTSFTGREIGEFGVEPAYFKFPGGEIPLSGTYEEIYSRFEDKGFKPEVIEEVLFRLFGSVASEAAISFEKIINSQDEFVGREIRKEDRSEIKLGVDRLPRQKSGKTLFSASANN